MAFIMWPERKIGLSQRGAIDDMDRKALETYQAQTEAASRTRMEELVGQLQTDKKSDKGSSGD